MTHVMKSTRGVGKYQILQRDMRTLEIAYTETKPLAAEEKESIARTLRRHLGEEVEVRLTRVADMSKERSGKHRWLKSLVTADDARRAREAHK